MTMFRITHTLLGLAALVLIFSACKKKTEKPREEDHTKHPHTAEITITSPSAGQAFDHKTTVVISGKIEASEELHGYRLIIRQKSDQAEAFSIQKHAHGKTLSFSESWENNVTGMQDMELEVIAVIDHDGGTVSKKLDFHCHGD
jgi:hypothetical protein